MLVKGAIGLSGFQNVIIFMMTSTNGDFLGIQATNLLQQESTGQR